ncbi:hypothetical protein QJ043_09265 [Olsenella sp. YH-ols2217]|uniref:Peptidoglycan hydrolase PcsB coiled-coil domain-containing protein n=1 Tax=Kribbibacterium absianum TaxID=3044210 RepID=A0ABT6ZMI1_9ACTN|nr:MULTISPECIES: hypothetical protein [unclassified Olsenella]MDJ1122323.1 hypothetical protein [Olsenella sp. YH-ols2216]MDJ1130263.1 hypothetical protein [Olsenella sp. YH-ols2217]
MSHSIGDGRTPLQAPESTLHPSATQAPCDSPEGQDGSSHQHTPHTLSRRGALKLLGGLGLSAVAAALLGPEPAQAASASQSTLNALADAQAQYDAAQEQLNALADQYEAMAQEMSATMDKIETVNGQIAETEAKIEETQAQIAEKERELAAKKEVLAARVSSNYKSGGTNFLEVLMSSSSFEELTSNIYYMNKMTQADVQLIDEVTEAKKALDAAKSDLEIQKANQEQQKAQLEELKAAQAKELDNMQAKQAEASALLDSLSAEVQQLMAQRDAEVLAAAKAEQAEREKAAAAAAAAAAASSSSSRPSVNSNGTAISSGGGSSKGQAIVNACYRTPSPGAGYCAMWVSQVYQNAGYGYPGGNAVDQYYAYCSSSNRANLQAGMLVAVPTHPHTSAGRIYGHVGIYIGGGMVMENVGYINTQSLDSWCSYYGASATPRWGWA